MKSSEKKKRGIEEGKTVHTQNKLGIQMRNPDSNTYLKDQIQKVKSVSLPRRN